MENVTNVILGNKDLSAFGVKSVDERNMERRLPVILLVDTSKSMEGEEEELQKSVADLYDTLLKQHFCHGVELSVMSFNSDLEIMVPMQELALQRERGQNLKFECRGCTYTGLALKMALTHLEDRKKVYKEHKPCIRYMQPILFLISDGRPECYDSDVIPEEERAMREAKAYIKSNVAANKLAVVAIEIGRLCDHSLMVELTGLSDERHVFRVSDKKKIADVFKFTSTLIRYSSIEGSKELNNCDVRSLSEE